MATKGITTRGAQGKGLVPDELVEVFLDSRVRDSLTLMLTPFLTQLLTTTIDSKFADYTSSLSDIVKDYKIIHQRFDKLVDDNKKLADENKSLRKELDEIELYSRRDDLIIHGLGAESYSDASSSSAGPVTGGAGISNVATEEMVVKFCRDSLGVHVTNEDISVAHRLPTKTNRSTSGSQGPLMPAPIIVRFTRRRIRDAVFGAKKQLKNTRPGVFINEHLTPRNAELYRQARLLVKQKKLVSAWTYNCQIFIKDSEMTDARSIKVNCLLDMPQ
jgi:cell division protein FtsB